MGGFDASGYPTDYMEVFDIQTKEIKKIFDDQSNWMKVPIPTFTAQSFHTCAVSLVEKNAFVILGSSLPLNFARYCL